MAPDVAVVVDYLRESQARHEQAANLGEAGLRYQLNDWVTLGAGTGIGIGIGRDSLRFRAIASVQIGFGGQ